MRSLRKGSSAFRMTLREGGSVEAGEEQSRNWQEATEDERMLRDRKSAEWYSEETEEGGKGLAFSEQVIMGQEP